MTKEQAIKHLKLMQSGARNAIRYTKNDKEISEEERKEDIEIHQDQLEAFNMAIKALEQPTMDKAMIHTLAKENDELKVEIGRLRQALEQQSSEDCVNRQAVLDKAELIELEDGQSFMCIDPEDVKALPPVTPTHGICMDCKWWDSENNKIGYCNACKHGHWSGTWDIGIYRKTKADFYCADFEKRGNEK